jgi:hypothetical protein
MEFDANTPTELCKLMGKYGSDKGNEDLSISPHNYTTLYYKLFNDIRYKNLRIFELGLGTNNVNLPSNMGPDGKPGASLKGWADFFPNSSIFGADIDRDILFNTERIKTYYCNQLNPIDIKKLWNNPELEENFDIIIEDGLHTPEANICFFENSIHKLKKNGYYIIEDIYIDTSIFEHIIENNWSEQYPYLDFKIIKLPILQNCSKTANNIVLIHYKI